MLFRLSHRSFLRPVATVFTALATALLTGPLLWAADAAPAPAKSDGDAWITLSNDLTAWKEPTGDWFMAESVRIDRKNSHRLAAKSGSGIMVNGKTGQTHNLISRQEWGDVEVSLEFLIPNHSNSGVKLESVYEIQIFDSWKVEKPTGADCGGIYPRAEEKPHYHHIDEGVPPLVNAAKKPGEWQTLEIIFHAPRFDAGGKKIANAMFEKVLLNGKLVQDHSEARTPTGAIWRSAEHPTGPLLLQADHGPVAFRNVRIRPLPEK